MIESNLYRQMCISQDDFDNFKTMSNKKDINSMSINDVIDWYCDVEKIDKDLLLSKTRKREVVYQRNLLVYILRFEMGISLLKIGLRIGGRDHSTIIHALKVLNYTMQSGYSNCAYEKSMNNLILTKMGFVYKTFKVN